MASQPSTISFNIIAATSGSTPVMRSSGCPLRTRPMVYAQSNPPGSAITYWMQ